ncbi:MAG: sulfite exporter TauE/SafE family protein [Candidatus Pacebacteria bacterium]|nr:sulfite exporter TauE/SafE family protein [Candidatus Paceibacterota bacterium]
MSITLIIVMILIGIFTGLVTGLTGASGVMVVVPLLTVFLDFPIHKAIGTSLMVDIMAPLSISYIYFKHGNIDIKSGIWIAVGSIFGAQLGATFAAGTPELGLSGAFGIFMIIMGVVIYKKGLNQESIVKKMKKVVKFETEKQKIITALILGILIGIMTGIFGAGGGGMILIILIFVLNFPLRVAIGTSALIMAITALSGTIGYALHGNIQPIAGLILGISAAGSGVVSARFANKINEQILSKVVGIIFIILGVIMSILNLI